MMPSFCSYVVGLLRSPTIRAAGVGRRRGGAGRVLGGQNARVGAAERGSGLIARRSF